jgi:hypothetical protein
MKPPQPVAEIVFVVLNNNQMVYVHTTTSDARACFLRLAQQYGPVFELNDLYAWDIDPIWNSQETVAYVAHETGGVITTLDMTPLYTPEEWLEKV